MLAECDTASSEAPPNSAVNHANRAIRTKIDPRPDRFHIVENLLEGHLGNV